MRRPSRARNRALLWILLGAALIAGTYLAVGEPKKDTLAGVVPIVGATIAFFAFCYLVYAQVEVWRQRRLVNNPDAARWTIAPDVWRAFVALNDRLNAQASDEQFRLDDDQRGLDGPVEIVMDRRAIRIGDDFRSLPVGGFSIIQGPFWIEGPPACIQFRFINHGGETVSGATWAVRVPVAPGAERAAAAVFAQQSERLAVYSPPARPQDNRLRRNVALAVALVAGAAFGGTMLAVKRVPDEWQVAALVTAITGALVCPAALLCAAVWHVRARSA